jgi:hypothetical protein
MGYVSDAQRKAVHASKADGGKGAPAKMEAPLEFNAGLRKASADGELDDNPKFKAAVDAAPVNMNYDSPAKQFAPVPAGPVRPVGNVFSPQTQQVASQMYGEEIPGSYDRSLPQGMYANTQEAITAKTNSRMAQALGGALSPFSKKGCKYKK